MTKETKLWQDYNKYIAKQNKEIAEHNRDLLEQRAEARKGYKDPYEQAKEYNKNKKWWQFSHEVSGLTMLSYYNNLS